MTIKESKRQDTLILTVTGRLDSTTAPQLEAALVDRLTGITKLVMDFSALDYISSAGIRILIRAYKEMDGQSGRLVVRGAGEEVTDVLTITGLAEKITLEKAKTEKNAENTPGTAKRRRDAAT